MTRTRICLAVVIGLVVHAGWPAAVRPTRAHEPSARPPKSGGHTHGSAPHGHGHGHEHDHPPVPAAYVEAHVPSATWTDPKMLARGQEIYRTRCALCHGESGDGKGPGAAGLRLKPADLTDARMVAEMPGNYWVWRVSEGGLVEPFRSKGSAMPAWKGELSLEDRWAVIAYAHTLSGHRGPHDGSEHPELRPRIVTGEGTVVALRRDRQQIVLEHGPIEGFMDAMTMGYRITPLALLDRVKPGDRVRFTIDTGARAITGLDRLGE